MSFSCGENKDIQNFVDSLNMRQLSYLIPIMKSPLDREQLQDLSEYKYQQYVDAQTWASKSHQKVIEKDYDL